MKKLTTQTLLMELSLQKPELFIKLRELDDLILVKCPQFVTISRKDSGIFIVAHDSETALAQTIKVFYEIIDFKNRYHLKQEGEVV
jgi:hypothetical protein